MRYEVQDSAMALLFYKNTKNQHLKNKNYSQTLLSEERDRVFDLMNNNGYYDFKRQYVFFEIDTTALPDNKIIVKESVVIPHDKSEHKIYKIDSVIFTTSANSSFRENQSIQTHNQVTYKLANNRYYPRVIDWRIFIKPDSLYSKKWTLETQKQLSYLDMFKFVNIVYDSIDERFVSQIFTSPLNKYQTSLEGGFSLISNQNQASGWPGSFLNFNAKNRNTFKGLEILQFNANASMQGIKGTNKQTTDKRYSRLQFGGDLSLTFPQFIFPQTDHFRSRIGKYNPKTKISLGVNFEDRLGEYERTTFNTIYGYSWQLNNNSRLTFQPLDMAFIKTANTSTAFENELAELEANGNISYVNAFRSSFISNASMALDFNRNSYGLGNQDSYFIHSALEYGGLAQLLLGSNPLNQDSSDFTYYKYLKGNIDFRQNFRLNSKTAFTYRVNVGVAYVYGKSRSLPYEKYFFSGGSNSIRAWQPRRLGPGAYAKYKERGDLNDQSNIIKDSNEQPVVDYSREQPGDILIELSAEYRRSFIGIIDYAFFVDAGNTWLWRSKTIENNDDPQNDDGIFQLKDFGFLNEFAVGTGAGLRLDFSFLVFRVDGAYKVFDPARPEGSRFVLDELRLNNLWKKINFNFGIGYPF